MEENEVIEGQDSNTADTNEPGGSDRIPENQEDVNTSETMQEEGSEEKEELEAADEAQKEDWEKKEEEAPDVKKPKDSPTTKRRTTLPKFTDLKKDPSKIRPKNLDFILDIALEVTVELGRARMLINDLLQLGQGSIVELTKLAGEPLEILVNGKMIAKGEVVVVNDKFGVRLTDVISPMELVAQLG
ncbi:MAG: flagellar motor switch protein FliN [Pseudomonadota bacterium]